jgi:hypothetical protein
MIEDGLFPESNYPESPDRRTKVRVGRSRMYCEEHSLRRQSCGLPRITGGNDAAGEWRHVTAPCASMKAPAAFDSRFQGQRNPPRNDEARPIVHSLAVQLTFDTGATQIHTTQCPCAPAADMRCATRCAGRDIILSGIYRPHPHRRQRTSFPSRPGPSDPSSAPRPTPHQRSSPPRSFTTSSACPPYRSPNPPPRKNP